MNKKIDIELLAEKYLAGSLTAEETDYLNALINTDKSFSKQFAQLLVIHGQMVDLLSEEEGKSDRLIPLKTQKYTSKKPYSFWLAVAACVTLLLSFVINFNLQESRKAGGIIAEISATDYAVWGECTLPTAKGSQLSTGKLELKEGLATLHFISGAEVILDGAVSIELLSAMSLKLEEGLLVSDIPESAHGFTIVTPGAKAIDHGTRFLTKVSKGGGTTVMDVLEGEVELVDDRTKESRFFNGGEGASISVKKDGFAKRTHKRGEFSLAESSASDTGVTKFVSISTADPGGRDATVIRGDFDFHHDPSLVMIKNTNDQFSRKGYLGFDCSTLNLEDAKSVELIMNFVYSGYGAAALSKTSTFSVWGILSDDLDTWKQGRIPWATAPANIDDAGILNTEFARRLGEFSVPRGRHNSEYRFKSEDLLSLIQKDKNQFLTLAIVCEDFHAGSDFVYSMIGGLEKSGKAPSLNFAF